MSGHGSQVPSTFKTWPRRHSYATQVDPSGEALVYSGHSSQVPSGLSVSLAAQVMASHAFPSAVNFSVAGQLRLSQALPSSDGNMVSGQVSQVPSARSF